MCLVWLDEAESVGTGGGSGRCTLVGRILVLIVQPCYAVPRHDPASKSYVSQSERQAHRGGVRWQLTTTLRP